MQTATTTKLLKSKTHETKKDKKITRQMKIIQLNG